MATWLAAWGAVLSTMLAVLQISTWRNARPRLTVTCQPMFKSVNDNDSDTFGTIVDVKQGGDILKNEMVIEFIVTNHGDKAVQVSAVVIESVDQRLLGTFHVSAKPLPIVLEPRTSEIIEVQKEHIDMTDSISFLGVVDATGRRHAAPRDQSIRLTEACWAAPTRVKWFRRKDDPSVAVRAFQAKSNSRFKQRELKNRERIKVLVSRATAKPPPPPTSNTENQ